MPQQQNAMSIDMNVQQQQVGAGIPGPAQTDTDRGAEEISPEALLDSLAPELRQQILMEADEEMFSTFPDHIAAEARALGGASPERMMQVHARLQHIPQGLIAPSASKGYAPPTVKPAKATRVYKTKRVVRRNSRLYRCSRQTDRTSPSRPVAPCSTTATPTALSRISPRLIQESERGSRAAKRRKPTGSGSTLWARTR